MTTKDLQDQQLDRLAVLQVIQEWAFYRDGGDWTSVLPDNLVTDSQSLDYTITASPGQMVSIRVYDENDNVSAKTVVAK